MKLTRRRRAAPPQELPPATTPPVTDPTELTPGLPHHSGLTAAVARVDGSWTSYRFGDRAWQADAWRLYDITGQLRFVANWSGASMSRCRMYVAEVDEQGELIGETQDPDIKQLAAGPLGIGPAKAEAIRLAGINLFVPGECYIMAEADGLGPGSDRWWVVSGSQVKRQGDQISIRRPIKQGGGWVTFREGVDLLLRVWTPHPKDVDEPDSPTRSAIPDLREIEALRKREFAELDSRLAGAGVLGLPQDIDFPRGPDDPPGVAGFQAMLGRAMAASLSDRSSAEALVPIMFTAPAELLDKIRHMTFWTDLSAQLLPLRESAVRSLGQSLDVPPEVMLGLGSSNHWSAWAISEDAVTTQIKPPLGRLAEALTEGYLRPQLEEWGADPDRYVYAFDTAALTVRANRSADAVTFHDKILISDDAARTAGAWEEGDAPDEQEILRRIVQAAALSSPTLVLSDPTLRAIIGLGAGPEPPPGQDSPTTVVPQQEPPQQDGTPPAGPPSNTDNPPSDGTPAAALMPVAHLTVIRALTLAGGRLISHRHRDRWPGTPRHALHTRHGPVSADQLPELLRGAWDDLSAAAADIPVDQQQLQKVLSGYVTDLLTRGIAHDRQLLADLLYTATLPPARVREVAA